MHQRALLSRASSAPLKLESGELCGTLRSSTKNTCQRAQSTPGARASGASALNSDPPASTSVNAPRSCRVQGHIPQGQLLSATIPATKYQA